MRDLNQPEAMDQTPPLDPWVETLGADRPRQASPAFKVALRRRLTSAPAPMADARTAGGPASAAGRRRGLSLILALGLGLWWLARPAGAPESAPAPLPVAAPTHTVPALPTAMTLVTPSGGVPRALPATPAGGASQAPRPGVSRPGVSRPGASGPGASGPGAPALLAPALASPTALPAGGAEEASEQDPRLLPTAEPSATATATEPQLPPEPPTATALPPVDFPTPTPDALLGPPSAPLAP